MLRLTDGSLFASLCLGRVAILLSHFLEFLALARIHAITLHLGFIATAVPIETTLKRRAAAVAISAPETDLDISKDHFSR
jgi:hypothetical protein